MTPLDELGMSMNMDVVRVQGGAITRTAQPTATEVPCTINADGVEVATLSCTPHALRELAVGFLYSSGFISGTVDLAEVTVDERSWTVSCRLARTPDPRLLERRMYTSGCGRGIVFASLADDAGRQPLASRLHISPAQITALAMWLQSCSALFRETGCVHAAAISDGGELPLVAHEDVARHCAVDKAIGARLLAGGSFAAAALVSSGRTSAEILSKARRAGIAVIVSRGGPTHQAVLRARELGITLVGFARGSGFTVYSHPERVEFGE